MRDAEKSNNLEQFISVVHLCIPLYACTNVPRYLKIATELVTWFEAALDVVKQLVENFVFFCITGNGKLIFANHAHEVINHYFCQAVSHHVLPDMTVKVCKAVMQISALDKSW